MANYSKLNHTQLNSLWNAITDLSEIQSNSIKTLTPFPKNVALNLVEGLTNFGFLQSSKLIECSDFELFTKLYDDYYGKNTAPDPLKGINKFAIIRTYD